MDVGQKVKIMKSVDKGAVGEVVGTFTKSVPVPTLRVGETAPTPYCKVKLDETHTKSFPVDWVEAV